MARLNDLHSVIVSADSPNLTENTYTEVFGGTPGCTIVLNGTLVQIAATSNIAMLINTVSGGTGCYLLGSNKNVYDGSGGVPY